MPLFLTAVLGVSSGLFGSLPMIQVLWHIGHHSRWTSTFSGPPGSGGGGEGGGWQPDDRLLLLRPHPWQPACLLAWLPLGSSQLKPLSGSAADPITTYTQVVMLKNFKNFINMPVSKLFALQVLSWVLLTIIQYQACLLSKLVQLKFLTAGSPRISDSLGQTWKPIQHHDRGWRINGREALPRAQRTQAFLSWSDLETN